MLRRCSACARAVRPPSAGKRARCARLRREQGLCRARTQEGGVPEPSVFCTMTAALVCRRSQVPGTAPVPYRRHRQRTAALGVLSRPSFSGEPCERPPGAGQLVRLGRLPISFIPCILRGRGRDSERLLACKPGRCHRPFPCMQAASVGEGARRLTVSEPSRAGASADPALLGLLRCYCN